MSKKKIEKRQTRPESKHYAREPDFTWSPEDIKSQKGSHWEPKLLANANLFADAKEEAEAKRDWLENCNLATSEVVAKYGVPSMALWYYFGPRPFPSPNPRKWEVDAKLKAAIEADWFGNLDLTNEEVAAKHGISRSKLWYHFGKRGRPIGRPELPKPERASRLIRRTVTIPENRETELKEIVAKWMEEDISGS